MYIPDAPWDRNIYQPPFPPCSCGHVWPLYRNHVGKNHPYIRSIWVHVWYIYHYLPTHLPPFTPQFWVGFFRPNIHWVDLGDLALFERFGVLPKTIWKAVVASRCRNRFRPIDNQGVLAQQNASRWWEIETPWIKAGTNNYNKTIKYYKSGVTCLHTVYRLMFCMFCFQLVEFDVFFWYYESLSWAIWSRRRFRMVFVVDRHSSRQQEIVNLWVQKTWKDMPGLARAKTRGNQVLTLAVRTCAGFLPLSTWRFPLGCILCTFLEVSYLRKFHPYFLSNFHSDLRESKWKLLDVALGFSPQPQKTTLLFLANAGVR